MAVWSIVRYKPLEGCVDQFLKEVQRLEKDSEGSRTKAISAYEVDELRRVSGKNLIL